MIITALRLRNIKSFVDAELHFSRGINVIAGANGAGKSTIIESVGLALFNAWPQKFKDGNARAGFLRNGEKEGSIEVDVLRGDAAFTVRCDLGSRTRAGRVSIDYERVLRDEAGRELASSAGRKTEFQEDIREHILGAARIDDERLFSDIIGTEQGAFDDPFTRPETDRKKLFEKILGIEDFQDFERQFRSLVKMQRSEADTLEIRVGENADVPAECEEARVELLTRETQKKDAGLALKTAAANAAAARRIVDTLSVKRDALAKAQAEQSRLDEKLRGEETAAAQAQTLVDESRKAAEALHAAQAGHEAFLAAEKELTALRAADKERDAADKQLTTLKGSYDTQHATLAAKMESARGQREQLAGEITEGEKDLVRRDATIEQLRLAYAALQEEKKGLDERSAFATKLRSYVQDVNTVQQTLDNADERLRDLRAQLGVIRSEQDVVKLPVDFLPQLAEEADRLFAQYLGEGKAAQGVTPFASMLEKARVMETEAQHKTDDAAGALGRKAEEGKGAKTQREESAVKLDELRKKHAKLEKEIDSAAGEMKELEITWNEQNARLSAQLEAHADLDQRIAAAEKQREEHHAAHESYLAQKSAAESLVAREQSFTLVSAAVKETRAARNAAAKDLKKREAVFSEDDYAAKKTVLDEALENETSASNTLAEWKARVEEQKNVLKKLEKELREFERLRLQSSRARTEADFSSELHARVVRELAQHVGASIVRALSAFAANLYQRIAPEQGLVLVWDPATYAVELRGEQGRVRGRELSGGQLMGVSLAVKLALIKWYAQCRVGFLDEPTTHLDRETRRHLADVIQHLEQLTGDSDPWFDQLFVISHEESFAGAGHLVELRRDSETGSCVV